MTNSKYANALISLSRSLGGLVLRPRAALLNQIRLQENSDGISFASRWPADGERQGAGQAPGGEDERVARSETSDPLLEYFDANTSGPGIHKWLHYFEIYNRHLAKFVDKDVHVMEIGIYSGGSLRMWRSYFGPRARITGMDVEPGCKMYENEHTKIVIGDQQDRSFWKKFWADSPPVDVIIDDGGHTSEQQRVTLEECLLHLRPGGVFICEDIHTVHKRFASYLGGLTNALNAMDPDPSSTREGETSILATPFQAWVHSVHYYPYLVVIEKREKPLTNLCAVKHGTEWLPYLQSQSTVSAGRK